MYELPSRDDIEQGRHRRRGRAREGQPHPGAPHRHDAHHPPAPGRVLTGSGRPAVSTLREPRRSAPSTSTATSTSRADGRRSDRRPVARAHPRALVGVLGDPQDAFTGHPRHRHQRQGLDRPDDHRAAGRARPVGRHLHQPAPASGSTSASPANGEPITDEDLAERASPSWPRSSRCSGIEPSLLRAAHRGGASAGSPRTRSTWRWSRSGCSVATTPPTWSTPTSPWSPTSARTTPTARATGARPSPRRRPASSSPTPSWCWGSPTRSSSRCSSPRARVDVWTRPADFDVVSDRPAVGGHMLDVRTPLGTLRGPLPPAARQPPGRQPGLRDRRRRGLLRPPARPRDRPGRARRGHHAGSVRGHGPRSARADRRCPQPRGGTGRSAHPHRGVRRPRAPGAGGRHARRPRPCADARGARRAPRRPRRSPAPPPAPGRCPRRRSPPSPGRSA